MEIIIGMRRSNDLLKFENSITEYKSLKKVDGKSADLKDLAKTCVCMASAQGGYFIFLTGRLLKSRQIWKR